MYLDVFYEDNFVDMYVFDLVKHLTNVTLKLYQ